MTEIHAGGRLVLEPGRIAKLTLSAPETKNAMSSAMWQALPVIVGRIAADASIRALVVTGAGGCFSAGADIGEFGCLYADVASAAAANADIRAALAALRSLPQPAIAAVSGPCVGGGVAMALACDHVISAEDAFFAIPPARLGIAYSPEDTAMLLERISAPRAKDMLMSARRLSAPEAADWGLIDRIATDPPAEAEAYAALLADLSPASIRQTKRTVNALAATARDPAIAKGLSALFQGPDFAEGRAAFLERRKPQF